MEEEGKELNLDAEEAPKEPINRFDSLTAADLEKAAAPEAAPGPAPALEPVPAPVQAPAMPEPPAAPVPPIEPVQAVQGYKGGSGDLKRLRTFEGDVAETLAGRNASRTSMAIAENKKRGGGDSITNFSGGEEKSHAGRKIFVTAFSLALIAVGAIGGYYLYSRSPLAATPPAQTQQQSQSMPLVPFDSSASVPIDGLGSAAIISKIQTEAGKPQSAGTIKAIILVQNQNGTPAAASAQTVASAMSVPAPDIIMRTLEPIWMLGVYADGSGAKIPFVIVKTDIFQNAFAGMLQWEADMPYDLKPYMGSAAPSASSSPAATGGFRDEIVKNKDVRAYFGADGTEQFAYSFVDNSTLVVAGGDGAIAEIVSRLENQAFVR